MRLFFCVMFCAWETLCALINATTVTCETLRRRSGRMITKGKSKSEKILQTLNYIFGLFMKYSPHFEWGVQVLSFTLASLSRLVRLPPCGVRDEKSMRKSCWLCVTYVKTRCPRSDESSRKKSLSALAFGSFSVHTPLFIVS